MDRRITNTAPATITSDTEVGRIQLEERIPLDQSCQQTSLKSPTFIPTFLRAPTIMISPVGSKRKASQQESPSKEEVKPKTLFNSEGRRQLLRVSVPPFRAQESSSFSKGEPRRLNESVESEEEASYREKLGYETIEQGRLRVTVDDLDGTVHRMPPPPRKYRRRNSFFIHRDSNYSSSTLQDLHMARFWDGTNASKKTPDACDDCEGGTRSSEDAQGPGRRRRANSLDERTSPNRAKPDDGHTSRSDSTIQAEWGNASWANSDDTHWYSALSSLSFDFQPTIPTAGMPCTASYFSVDIPKEMTLTTSGSSRTGMDPPAPRRSAPLTVRKGIVEQHMEEEGDI
jgi:hypothetical protein